MQCHGNNENNNKMEAIIFFTSSTRRKHSDLIGPPPQLLLQMAHEGLQGVRPPMPNVKYFPAVEGEVVHSQQDPVHSVVNVGEVPVHGMAGGHTHTHTHTHTQHVHINTEMHYICEYTPNTRCMTNRERTNTYTVKAKRLFCL